MNKVCLCVTQLFFFSLCPYNLSQVCDHNVILKQSTLSVTDTVIYHLS